MMLAISGIACALLLAQGGLTEQGIRAFNEGRYSVALAKLAEAAKDSSDKQARLFLALSQAATGSCTTALPALSALAKDEQLAGIAAVKCYSAGGDETKAFTLLDEMNARWPNDADVLYLKARLHMKAFNDTTLAMFQRTPASYRVHELSAEIFEVQSRYDEAVGEYQKAIEMNPQAPDLHFRLGRAILLAGHNPDQLAKAATAFLDELKLNPEDGACEFQLGQIAQVSGQKPDAKTHFEKALALSPQFVQAMIALGKLETSDKQYDQAIGLLTKAVDLQPSNETAHYALQMAYRDAGQMDKAKEQKAILDKLQKPPEGEFSDFLKKLGEKPPPAQE
jgi:tetratricopeptide (TPR) repeat protein